jgi:hypothetical protein
MRNLLAHLASALVLLPLASASDYAELWLWDYHETNSAVTVDTSCGTTTSRSVFEQARDAASENARFAANTCSNARYGFTDFTDSYYWNWNFPGEATASRTGWDNGAYVTKKPIPTKPKRSIVWGNQYSSNVSHPSGTITVTETTGANSMTALSTLSTWPGNLTSQQWVLVKVLAQEVTCDWTARGWLTIRQLPFSSISTLGKPLDANDSVFYLADEDNRVLATPSISGVANYTYQQSIVGHPVVSMTRRCHPLIESAHSLQGFQALAQGASSILSSDDDEKIRDGQPGSNDTGDVPVYLEFAITEGPAFPPEFQGDRFFSWPSVRGVIKAGRLSLSSVVMRLAPNER